MSVSTAAHRPTSWPARGRVIAAACLLVSLVVARADEAARRVIVLANSADPDSVALARFYAAQREVPVENIVALPMPPAESITWREFIDQIYQPVQDELVRRNWINALPSTLVDALGRKRYSILGHRISYLVVCRGVPLRIYHDPTIVDERQRAQTPVKFQTNQAAVDSELSLLAQSGYNTLAMLTNPLYAREKPTPLDLDNVVKVSRLDGPTPEDARRLVQSALEGERQGLLGRYYVDLGGPHADGDQWFKLVRAEIDDLGFDGDVEESGGTFDAGARFDAPVLYFGWYAGEVNGPFLRPDFRFPPGAIALHLHSYSAHTLRSATSGWTGPLVARGVAATVGNVFEPYLQLTHRPNLLLHALARGKTFGDAAYYALPELSWQAVAVGDPLYRPFAVPLEQQLEHADRLPTALASYAFLRQARLLEKRGRAGQAIALLQRRMVELPGLAVQLALGRLLAAADRKEAAVQTLEPVRFLREFRHDHWMIGRQIARELGELGAIESALTIYRNLAIDGAPAAEARLAMLTDAKALADKSGDLARSIEFNRLVTEATPLPPAQPAKQ